MKHQIKFILRPGVGVLLVENTVDGPDFYTAHREELHTYAVAGV
jgi:hypothetical protein